MKKILLDQSKDQSKRMAHGQIDKADFFISICGYSNGKSDVNISVGGHQIPEVVMQAMAEAKIKSVQLNEEKKNG